ncbi:MAG: ClcB-like voltage-gated chloride channel protein [Opitutales bacterium]|nr:ClcB-like voltage-gated chloride channel protein [Opitutales bacterium]
MKAGGAELKRLILGLRLVRSLKIDENHTLLLWAAVCGFLGALATLGLKYAMGLMLHLFTGSSGGFVAAFTSIPPWQRLVVPVIGASCCGIILQLGKTYSNKSGADYMEAITLGDGIVRVRSTILRSVAAMFAIAGGESIGREGPLVQMAALASSAWGRLRHLPPARLRVMVACGAASGLAAAYHSPLGGAFFVAEIVIGSIAMETLGPLLIASTVSALTVQSIEGFDPLYLFPKFSLSSASDILAYAIAGVAMGLASVLWMKMLDSSKPLFARLKLPLWGRLALGGLLIGLLAMRHPEVCGNGKSLVQEVLADNLALSALAMMLVLKVVATCISFGSGAIGGVFTPSLLIGATLGYILALCLNFAHMSIVPSEMALISMGAFLAAAANAPATAILMIFEMSMQYNVVLPLMVSTVIAYATARSISHKSLYSNSIKHGARGVLDRPMAEIQVADMMHKDPPCLRPQATFKDVAKAFLKSPRQEIWLRSANRFHGCIQLSEVGPFLADAEFAETVLASDIATENVPTLSAKAPLPDAFKTFANSPLSRLPVMNEQGEMIGEVTRADVFLTISELTRRG